MKKEIVYIENNSFDPCFNLALEQYVFDSMPRDREYFWLWQNRGAIVVGKHQNTMEEINLPYTRENGIQVVRRLSGGGAVYHDMGNVNFTFIADTGDIEKLNLRKFCEPVVETLKKIGVKAEANGRNDITIEGRKFSGNSQYVKNGRILHHGTLMFDSNLSVVERALNVSEDKYESKGFRSVKSRVTNIRPYLEIPLDMEGFKRILRENMVSGEAVAIYHLTGTDLGAVNQIRRERYETWEWTFGESPEFAARKTRRIDGVGKLEVFMRVEKGRIREYESFGDYFGNGATEELKNVLRGCPLRTADILCRLREFDLDSCYMNLKKDDFADLLVS